VEAGGRTPEERRAAAEVRARARAGEPVQEGDEELAGGAKRGARDARAGGRRDMARYYGGSDIFLRRRLLAIGAAVVVLLILFLVAC
jgi:hypothetical protein